MECAYTFIVNNIWVWICSWCIVQWDLRIVDTLGTQHFVLCREVVLFRRLFCIECITRVLLVCPLFGGLSSFGVSFYWRFHCICNLDYASVRTSLFRLQISECIKAELSAVEFIQNSNEYH